MKILLLITVVISVFSIGCKPNETTIEKIVEKPNDERMEKLIKVDETMTDEELADSGEQLLSFHTFPLAEKAFKMALIKNPNNLKAQFYTEGFLKIYTVNKGILNRIKPFARKQGRIKDLEKTINDIPNVPTRKFLLDGTEDIKTVTDIQNYYFETQQNWNTFRKWLIKNYDKSLTLNLDPMFLLVNMGVESKHSCEIIDEQSGKAVCNYNNVFQKKLAPADLMALRQMTAGWVLFYNFYTSYNFDGADKLAQIDPQGTFNSKQSYQYLVDVNPNFLTFRQKSFLKDMVGIGSDMVAAVKYAAQFQKELCPKGNGQSRQRAGHLFHDGFCITQEVLDKELPKFEKVLVGSINTNQIDRYGHDRKVKLDYLAWSRNPPSDLKAIGPASFDACGIVSSLYDKTLGGIYPDKDAEDFVIGPKLENGTVCSSSSEAISSGSAK